MDPKNKAPAAGRIISTAMPSRGSLLTSQNSTALFTLCDQTFAYVILCLCLQGTRQESPFLSALEHLPICATN